MENKPTYNPHKNEPNYLKSIMVYLAVLFLGGFVFTYMFAYLFASVFNVEYQLIIDSIVATDLSKFSTEVIKANSLAQGCANLLGYVLSALFVIIILKNDLVNDFNNVKNNKKKIGIYTIICALGFVLLSYLIDLAFSQIVSDSSNQETIEIILKYGGMLPMLLATVIFAPIVEEIIYRKCIFSMCNKKGVVFSYVISIVAFTLPHMLSTQSDALVWLLQCVPYAFCGGLLCFIYHKSNYNIYPVIIAHMANNLLAVILVLI